MKATGIVRRIDDLGRVVVPKEIYYAHAYHYGDAQDAVKSSYNSCSGSGPQTAIAESKHPQKLKNTKCMTPQLC